MSSQIIFPEGVISDKDEISLKEIFEYVVASVQYLKRKWKIIVLFSSITGVGGLIYAINQKFVYTAELSFVLEDEKSSSASGFSGIASQFGFDLGATGGGVFSESNLMALMKTQTLVERTLLSSVSVSNKDIVLANMYIDSMDIKKSWKSDPELMNFKFSHNAKIDSLLPKQRLALRDIYNQVNAKLNVTFRDKKNSIIYIQYKSQVETFAKLFVEMLATNASEFYIDTRIKKAKTNMLILEQQTDSIRRELNSLITGAAIATDNLFNLNNAILNSRRAPSLQKQVDIQANTAILTQLVANLEMAKVSVRKETPLIQIIDKPTLPLAVKKIGRIRSLALFGICGAMAVIMFLLVRKRIKEILIADN